jgi:uncharacterized damage-inducible protein DinB
MSQPSPKEQFLQAFEREFETTMRVLRAYPVAKDSLRPHPKAKSARELAWIFALEQGLCEKGMTKGFDWSQPPQLPPPPDSFATVLAAVEQGHKRLGDIVRGMSDANLTETVKFFVAPKQLGDVPKIQFLWFVLCDQIHHRGQFSVYLRMADGKVPSIYGPSLDEPWM